MCIVPSLPDTTWKAGFVSESDSYKAWIGHSGSEAEKSSHRLIELQANDAPALVALAQCTVREVAVVNSGWILVFSEARDTGIPGTFQESATKLEAKRRPNGHREFLGQCTSIKRGRVTPKESRASSLLQRIQRLYCRLQGTGQC